MGKNWRWYHFLKAAHGIDYTIMLQLKYPTVLNLSRSATSPNQSGAKQDSGTKKPIYSIYITMAGLITAWSTTTAHTLLILRICISTAENNFPLISFSSKILTTRVHQPWFLIVPKTKNKILITPDTTKTLPKEFTNMKQDIHLMNFKIPTNLKIQFEETCSQLRSNMTAEMNRMIRQFVAETDTGSYRKQCND